MWILTYVGALFNGLTLLILGKSVLQPLGLTEPSSGSICWWHEVIVLWCLHWLFIKWKVKCSIFVVVVVQVWLQFSAAQSFMRNTRWVFVNLPVHMSQLKLYSKGVCVCVCLGSDWPLPGSGQQPSERYHWKVSLKKKIWKEFNWIYSHESRSDGFSDFLQDPGESPGHET